MNDALAQIIETTSPKFNKNVVDGSVKQILQLIPEYLDKIFQSSVRSLSSKIPLKYLGYRRMCPEEELNRLILSNSNKIRYDIAVSDLYVVEYLLEYDGQLISRPLYLPYTDKGNIIRISGTQYTLIPVLSDTVISPSHKEVFVRLLKRKIIFKRHIINFVVNGEKIPGQVIYADIIQVKNLIKDSLQGRVITPMSLYLLGEYGVRETMNRYAKTDKYIITTGNVDKYKNTHNIFETTNIKSGYNKEAYYEGSNIKFCLDKSVEITHFLENFIYGFLYVFHALPEYTDDFLDVYKDKNVQDELLHWRILLGRIAYKNTFSVDRICQDMEEHFDTLQGYLDNLIKDKLTENDVHVENFFDLLAYLMENFNMWLINNKEFNSDISNRYIDVLYYILYDIIIGFNMIILSVNKRASKKQDKLSYKEVSKIVSNELKTRLIFNLVKSSTMKLCAQLTESTIDIYYPKITSLLEDQSRGTGVKRGSKTTFPESTKQLKGHDLYIGSLLFLTKQAPSPRFRSNLYMDYNLFTGKLNIPQDIKETTQLLDDMLRGGIENIHAELLNTDDDNTDLE